jgi:hypothetical protein
VIDCAYFLYLFIYQLVREILEMLHYKKLN